MPLFRCPKHDSLFDSTTDSRPPGSGAKDHLPVHPANGHPDCPFCQKEKKQPTGVNAPGINQPVTGNTRRIA